MSCNCYNGHGGRGLAIRKVIKVGNSFAVTIPAEIVRELHLEEQSVEIAVNAKGEITLWPLREHGTSLTPEFVRAVDAFMDEYAEVLKGLADR